MNEIKQGDSLEVLEQLETNSVHAVITDPPYGLAFMGRDWDDFSPREYQEWCTEWAEKALEVLKPGGHLLAFSGNRTHHRLFTGVEDAGFEIRDTLTWHYGSGFPKASDISKTIDKRADAEREVVGVKPGHENFVGGSNEDIGVDLGNGEWQRPWMKDNPKKYHQKTAPATDAAKEWDGWKTSLKPATEFIVMARKPYEGATVDSVLENGTGALNIGACRVGAEDDLEREQGGDITGANYNNAEGDSDIVTPDAEGRYPANVIFDETAAEQLDEQVGELQETGRQSDKESDTAIWGNADGVGDTNKYFDGGGGRSRYFYTSKASKNERTENGSIDNSHPTVKPIDLMEWLVKLVTKEEQIVLDPFTGSGTTCKAAKGLNRQFIGIEKQAQWADIARVRCGLTPDDPSVVRDDDGQEGLEAYSD